MKNELLNPKIATLSLMGIEKYLKFLKKVKDKDFDANISECEKTGNLEIKLQQVNYWDFINSDEIEIIVKRFNPFYELPRYPACNTQPKGSRYGFIWPDDICLLDYFILRMREILKMPNGNWDILRDEHVDFPRCEENESLYNIFRFGNINFLILIFRAALLRGD